jgi:hypothetical protein
MVISNESLTSMTTKKGKFLRNLTGRAMLPEDKVGLEKWEKMFKEKLEATRAWPFPIIVPTKEKK